MASTQWYDHAEVQEASARGDFGRVLRQARLTMGLSQQQAGELVGYSAASISRLETGATRFEGVSTLRLFASTFGIPFRLFGLAHAEPSSLADGPDIVHSRKGGDPMQRRHVMLGGLAAITGVFLRPVPALADGGIIAELDDFLLSRATTPPVAPVTLPRLRVMLTSAQRDFAACRYRELAMSLPYLLRTAEATSADQPYDTRATAEALVADSYNLATDVLTKLHETGAAWATADRAVRAAAAADDPRAMARAQRLAAIVLRRSAHRGKAQVMMESAARQLATATGLDSRADASLYASMLCTTAYTAALTDNRGDAYDQLTEAEAVISEHGAAGFGVNDITLYGIGVARALGDYGRAVDYSRNVNRDLLGTPERHARYWEDTALAWWGRGSAEHAFKAMLNAEHAAPQEVRYRPWAHQLGTQLLEAPGADTVAGLREFSRRIGIA